MPEEPGLARRPLDPRGLVWIGVGALVEAVGLLTPYRLVVRGTRVPWGLVVVAVGLALLFWDRRKASSGERARERPPGPPP